MNFNATLEFARVIQAETLVVRECILVKLIFTHSLTTSVSAFRVAISK